MMEYQEREKHKKMGLGQIEELNALRRRVAELERSEASHQATETALRQSEERYRTIIENIEDGYHECDLTGKFRFCNDSFCRIIGYPEVELLGMSYKQCTDLKNAQTVFAAYHRIFQTGNPQVGVACEMIRKDGSVKQVTMSVSPINDPYGQTTGFRGIVRDETDRLAAEKALIRNEKKYRDIFENASEGIYQASLQGRFLSVNPALARMSGYDSPQDMIDSISDIATQSYVFPEDRFALIEVLKTQETIEGFEFQAYRKDKSKYWVSSNIRIVRDSQGQILYLQGMCIDISDRKRTEEELRESEEKYRTVVEQSNDGICLVKGNAFLFVNQKMVQIFGYDMMDELVGQPIEMMIDPTDRPRVLDINLRRQEGEPVPSTYEFKGRRKNGDPVYIQVSATKITFQGEAIALAVLRDNTEFRQAEEELKWNYVTQNIINTLLRLSMDDALLEKILDKAIDPIFSIPGLLPESTGAIFLVEDQPGVLVMKTQRGLPNPLQEICSRVPFGRCICGRAAQQREIIFADRLDQRHEICLREMIPHGHYCVPISFSGKVLGVINLYIPEGQPRDQKTEGLLTVIAQTLGGIIIRKQAEDAFQEREERFRTLFDLAADCIFILDPSTEGEPVIIDANRAAHTMHGYEEGELAGKQVSFLTTPESKLEILAQKAILMSGEPLTAISDHVRKDGTFFPVEFSARLIQIKGRPYIQAIGRDITAQRLALEEKARLESQLLQSQKMEAIGTLAGGIAHDFNNILTALIGYGNLLQMNLEKGTPLRSYADQILSSSEKAASLTRSLLAFSRKQPLALKPVKLNDILAGTEKLLRRLLSEDILFTMDLSADDTIIMGDSTQIDQILFNLATNARDAMPSGGSLTIETKRLAIDKTFVDVFGYGKPGLFVLLSISDTGFGMDENTKGKIFDPFFTTKEVGKGTGMGLSTVYGIVKQHNGYINVYSEPKVGTVFHVYFPAVSSPMEEEKPFPSYIRFGKETILVAEDNDEVRNLIRRLLAQYGYTVIEAIDGEDAIEKWRIAGEMDLMILDLIMPKKNGKEVYDEIKKTNPHTKVLFISGYARDIIIDKGLGEKEVDFLSKPLLPNVLLKRVGEMLDT